MRPNRNTSSSSLAAFLDTLALAAALALLLTLARPCFAQTGDSKPEELGKQRSVLYLRATHTPLADLGKDVDQIALLSETCRVKYGSTACGLSDKALESDKLEDRYEYYVMRPVEAHSKSPAVKIDRRNWVGSYAPARP